MTEKTFYHIRWLKFVTPWVNFWKAIITKDWKMLHSNWYFLSICRGFPLLFDLFFLSYHFFWVASFWMIFSVSLFSLTTFGYRGLWAEILQFWYKMFVLMSKYLIQDNFDHLLEKKLFWAKGSFSIFTTNFTILVIYKTEPALSTWGPCSTSFTQQLAKFLDFSISAWIFLRRVWH